MSNPVAGIDIVARLDQFKRDLAAIPDIGGKEAKALAAQMAKEIRAAERAARDAGKASRTASREVASFGDASGKVGQNAAKMAGSLQLVSPVAAEAAASLADLADIGEVLEEVSQFTGIAIHKMAIAAGVAAQAAALGYVAWRIYTYETERADAITATIAQTMENARPILNSTRDATVNLYEATGRLSEEQAALQRNANRAYDALQQAMNPTIGKIKELEEEQNSAYTKYVDFVDAIYKSTHTTWTPMAWAMDKVTTTSEELEAEQQTLRASLLVLNRDTMVNVATTDAATLANLKNKAAREALTEATKRAAEWEREIRKALGKRKEDYEDLSDAINKTAAIEMGAIMAQIEAEQRLASERATLNDRLAALDDTATETIERRAAAYQVEIDKLVEMGATAESVAAQRVQVEEWAAAEIAKIDEKAGRERLDRMHQQVGYIGDLFGTLSELASAEADAQSETSRQAARESAQRAKTLAVIGTTLNAIKGISEAASSAAPPFNLVPISVATAQGALTVGAAASTPIPSFADTPGLIQVAPGDYVAAGRTPEDVREQANRGDPEPAPRERRGQYTVAASGEVFARTVIDAIRLDTPYRRELRRGSAGALGFDT